MKFLDSDKDKLEFQSKLRLCEQRNIQEDTEKYGIPKETMKIIQNMYTDIKIR